MSQTPPTAPTHTPYKGSAIPFTIGLKPLEEALWLETCAQRVPHLHKRQHLLAKNRSAVLHMDESRRTSCDELLALVVDNLQRYHQATHKVDEGHITVKGIKDPVSRSAQHPLIVLGQCVQEDFCLLHKTPEGHVLHSALLCFPSSWRLADKIGRPLETVHAPVPDYAGTMAARVNLLFDRLRPDQLVWRYNWSLDEGDELFRPQPHQHDKWLDEGGDPLDHLHIRVERQTLRRLPVAGDIVFTIRIHTTPLSALALNAESRPALEGLVKQINALTQAQLAYKGLEKAKSIVIARLNEVLNTGARG